MEHFKTEPEWRQAHTAAQGQTHTHRQFRYAGPYRVTYPMMQCEWNEKSCCISCCVVSPGIFGSSYDLAAYDTSTLTALMDTGFCVIDHMEIVENDE
jgi:hypothetical protein